MTNHSQRKWTAIDRFIGDTLALSDSALDAALKASATAALPEIQVTACQGKLLQLLALLQGARKILEIGTLGGYSTIWLARALPPGGRLITLELDPHHAEVARSNLARAGLSKLVELLVGPALETLPTLAAQAPFDLIFIDADKSSTPEYFSWAMKFSRRGSLIIVDNVIRKGALLDKTADPAVRGMRRFIKRLAAQKGISSTVVQTVGSKGYDGFAVALVTGGTRPTPQRVAGCGSG
ncbi:MAG TPA: O-methyltransferase [Patescibacteria group bacterium]|nr:O-methyltransferase [Patescibacteria group bacterium]